MSRPGGVVIAAIVGAPHGISAAINRTRMLDRLLRDIAHTYKPNRKRGNQKELDKVIVVARALLFSAIFYHGANDVFQRPVRQIL